MRKVIHCDADCFFVALEMRDDNDLRGIPVAVGGDPGRRGVISTCNYEARAFGVRSAMASAHAKRLCPQLIILPHNSLKYREASAEMRRIFLDYTDNIEPLSLDEAYLDVTATHHCLGSATLIAKEIRRRIEREVGITVSAGVAVNKFLAKVASDWQKPDGLTVIEPDRIKFFLKQLPVSCIPGVGPSSLKKLCSRGITTCYDLQQLPLEQLVQCFGKFGQRLYDVSRGDDNRPVKSRELRKSLSVEHTFSHDIEQREQCYPLLSELADKLSGRLGKVDRKQSITKCFVKIKFAGFERTTIEANAKSISLPLLNQLFSQAWERYKKPVRLLGVGVRFDAPEPSAHQQITLF
ncbi:MAG: DNA polymerase IV [Cellvibrionaceae bacterium]